MKLIYGLLLFGLCHSQSYIPNYFVGNEPVSTVEDDWFPIIQDQVSPWTKEGISRDLIDSTYQYPGHSVLFQYVNKRMYLYDPKKHCLCNTSVYKMKLPFHSARCRAIASILLATIQHDSAKMGKLGDFEFVFSLDDFPLVYNTRYSPRDIIENNLPGDYIYPMFSPIKCWSKGGFAVPFFGSHEEWNINNYENLYSSHSIVPLSARKGVAIFRGGEDRGCSFDKGKYFDFNAVKLIHNHTRKGCGRKKLIQIAKKYPELIDYRGSEDKYMSMEEQSNKYKYVLSVEGYGGWADRLFYLIYQNKMVLFDQDHPCEQWFESLYQPMNHYIPFRNDFEDLPMKVAWANKNPRLMERVLENSGKFARRYFDKEGILTYMHVLLHLYSQNLKYNVTIREDVQPISVLWNITELGQICE